MRIISDSRLRAQYLSCTICKKLHPSGRIGLCATCRRWSPTYGPAIRQIAMMIDSRGRLRRTPRRART